MLLVNLGRFHGEQIDKHGTYSCGGKKLLSLTVLDEILDLPLSNWVYLTWVSVLMCRGKS